MKANLEPEVIEQLTREFVSSLPVNDDPYYKEAALKFLVREFAWILHERFPEQKNVIAEQLELMSELVKELKE